RFIGLPLEGPFESRAPGGLSLQSIVSGVPAVGDLPMAMLKQPVAVIMPGTGAATLELPCRQGEPKVFVSSFTPTSPLEPHRRAERHSLSLSAPFTRAKMIVWFLVR
ncbi:hypothetical protein EV126DRAFT_352069, partial [Verticillium dahliae]